MQDLEVLKAIGKAFDPLSELTDILSGEEYVTVSSVEPLLHHLSCQVCLQEEDSQLTKDIKHAVRFSTSGNVITPKRSCLKPQMVNMLVFLSHNL